MNLDSLTYYIALETHDWKKRLESLKKIQEISILYEYVINGDTNLGANFYLS